MFEHWWQWIFYSFCLITLIQLAYYSYFFGRVAFFQRKERSDSREHPVSVVICARDEAANIAHNLPGVLLQNYRSTHEVIVVNDNSQDESKYLLEGLHKQFRQLNVVELKQEAKLIPGKKFPLSIGIKTAKHEIILLTDADCVPVSEFWIQKMQDAFSDGVEIVLGYGAYIKKKGIVNKLIRFETFHTALQYLSYALAGLPYMGVGRNLAYKRQVFFRHKGFSSQNHLPGGDDDLFINSAATKTNTAIVIDKDAFTRSGPRETFGDWVRQKTRHYTTGRYYKPIHRLLLGLYSLSHFLYYPLFLLSLLFFDWRFALGVFAVRLLIQGLVYYRSMEKLDEKDLRVWFWLFDIWMFFYYLVFAPSLWKKPRANWK